MPKKFFPLVYLFFFMFCGFNASAQRELKYSLSELKAGLLKQNSNISQIKWNSRISKFYVYNKARNKKNLDSALFYAKTAYLISRANPGLHADTETRLVMAKVLSQMKKLPAVRAMLTDADKKLKMKLLLLLGKYYLFKSGEHTIDLDSAATSLKASIALSLELKDRETEQSARLYLINVQVERGDRIGAWPLFTELAKECERSNNLNGAADVYSIMGDHCLFTDTKEKIKYYTASMNLYMRAGNEEDRIALLKALGDVNFNAGKLELAEKQLTAVLNWFKANHYQNLQDTYYLLSVLNRFKGDFGHALFYAMEAVKSSRLTESDEAEGYYFSCLAQIYNEMGDDKNSVLWYRKTIESLHNQKSEFMYNNLKDLSDYLIREGKSDEVLALLKSVHNTSNSTPLENELIAAIKGNCYKYQKNYELAEKYYLEMLKWEELARVHTFNSSDSYYMLADFYISLNAYSKAEFYLKKILAMPAGTYPLSKMKDVYLQLYRADSAKNDLGSAIINYKKYKSLNDTIFNKDRDQQIQELLIKYDANKKDADNKLLRKEALLQRDQLQKADLLAKITISGTFALLAILALLYVQFKNRKQANQMLLSHQQEITLKNDSLQNLIDKQGKLLTEKEWLIKEIHHRVKNNLQVVMSLLNAQANYTDNEVAVNAIRDSQNRMQSITLIHQKLFQSDKVASIDIQSYIVDLMKFLCDTFHYNQRIDFEFKIPSIQFDVVQAMPLGLIINEAMTNIIKYAFPNGEHGKVKIELTELDNGYVSFTISDNGKGLPENFDVETTKTLGMTLMKGLSQQIDGELLITSDNGVSLNIKFPMLSPDDPDKPEQL